MSTTPIPAPGGRVRLRGLTPPPPPVAAKLGASLLDDDQTRKAPMPLPPPRGRAPSQPPPMPGVIPAAVARSPAQPFSRAMVAATPLDLPRPAHGSTPPHAPPPLSSSDPFKVTGPFDELPSGTPGLAAPGRAIGAAPEFLSAPPPAQIHSPLLRKAMAEPRADHGLLETETISVSRLRKLKRAGRLPWLVSLLLTSVLAGGVALALEERHRLQMRLAELTFAASESDRALARLRADKLAVEQAAQQAQAALADAERERAEAAQVGEQSRALAGELVRALGPAADSGAAGQGSLKAAASPPVKAMVEPTVDGARVTFDAAALFTDAGTLLSLDGMRGLTRTTAALAQLPSGLAPTRVVVEGRAAADARGRRSPGDWEQTAARAVAVARYLIEVAGLGVERVSISASPPRDRETPVGRGKRQGTRGGDRIELSLIR